MNVRGDDAPNEVEAMSKRQTDQFRVTRREGPNP